MGTLTVEALGVTAELGDVVAATVSVEVAAATVVDDGGIAVDSGGGAVDSPAQATDSPATTSTITTVEMSLPECFITIHPTPLTSMPSRGRLIGIQLRKTGHNLFGEQVHGLFPVLLILYVVID